MFYKVTAGLHRTDTYRMSIGRTTVKTDISKSDSQSVKPITTGHDQGHFIFSPKPDTQTERYKIKRKHKMNTKCQIWDKNNRLRK